MINNDKSYDNKTVTDNSEEPKGDIEMNDEGNSPGAAENVMQINTVPDQDIKPEAVDEVKEVNTVEQNKPE